jgi:hypothetical protein
MVVRKYLDEIVPKSDAIHECMELAQRIAEYEADFHTKGISQPDKNHWWEEIRQATIGSQSKRVWERIHPAIDHVGVSW